MLPPPNNWQQCLRSTWLSTANQMINLTAIFKLQVYMEFNSIQAYYYHDKLRSSRSKDVFCVC